MYIVLLGPGLVELQQNAPIPKWGNPFGSLMANGSKDLFTQGPLKLWEGIKGVVREDASVGEAKETEYIKGREMGPLSEEGKQKYQEEEVWEMGKKKLLQVRAEAKRWDKSSAFFQRNEGVILCPLRSM